MDKNLVPEVKTINWKGEGDYAVVNNNFEKLLLNKSVKLVLELINGINTIDDINNILINEYKDTDEPHYIEEIVEESIQLLIDNNIINMKEDEIDGWLQYE
ncbi:PqqD family peptide modification chaperone [Vallitalea guaymasensis]|uniref:PqqD family peptide modification chaperone n=1 Tax=Vallitalea guaymasensis TaxID=1185412 RepID=A0A8J8MDJ2_9FIRM|nr:PqqD family peptide modification chaperone [Vallitalea guaymasensis]QUH30859.1 PqqD family peptide modification chaperone [Vallitalea guaymasensis]